MGSLLGDHIIDVETTDGKKPVKFFTTKYFEYHIGWRKPTIRRLIEEGRFPDTPYEKEGGWGKIKLYTEKMADEAVTLVELKYPVYYRGRNEALRKAYFEEMNDYKREVVKLQAKWQEEDYIKEAPAEWRKKKWKMPA